MNKILSIFLLLPVAAFTVTGAVAADNSGPNASAGLPDDFNIEEHRKGRSVIMLEEAMETDSLQISLNERTGAGVVVGRICDQCEKISVIITPDTRAFHGNNEVPLASAGDRLGRNATVFIDMEKKKVTRIRW